VLQIWLELNSKCSYKLAEACTLQNIMLPGQYIMKTTINFNIKLYTMPTERDEAEASKIYHGPAVWKGTRDPT
jgi:hypothetical protein